MMALPELHAATASTSLVVLVDGVLVHEWYADGSRGQLVYVDRPRRVVVPLPAIAAAGHAAHTTAHGRVPP